MLKITLAAVGRCREKAFADLSAAYLKQLSAYARLNLVEIPQGKGEPAVARTREGKALLEKTAATDFVIALDPRGTLMTTPELATFLEKRSHEGRPLAFVIGGPDGLDEAVLARADKKWSLSPLTFPHMLARVMVLEQLYRAFSLNAGHPYHRE